MGMHRSELRRRRRTDAVATKATNRVVKTKERVRRDARMVETIKSGSPPYAPAVLSWLSQKLGKKASKIKADDVASLFA